LTAAHVVSAAEGSPAQTETALEVRAWGSQDWCAAVVAWVGSEDVALLRSPAAGAGARTPQWGRIEGITPVKWAAVGYPRASVHDRQRQPEHAFGMVSALTEVTAARFGLQITSRITRDETADTSGWVGMSGAAVFSGPDSQFAYLVGVIVSDERAYIGSLSALRIDAVLQDAGVTGLLGASEIATVRADALDRNVRSVAIDLPPPVPHFAGRDDVLASLYTADPIHVVTGLGGIGKSALAAAWANERASQARDVDVAWWFSAAERGALVTAMAGRYRQVTAQSTGGEAEADAHSLVTWLSNSRFRWLVVFDDAPGPETLEGLIPRGAGGRVLITSRFANWSRVTTTVHALDVLSEAAAASVLAGAAAQPVDGDCELLAHDLGCLPLALVQAGLYVRGKATTFGRYRGLLTRSLDRLLAAGQGGAGQTVAAVVRASVDEVTSAHGRASADLLSVLTCFAPSAIPRDLLDTPAIDGEPLFGGGDPLTVDEALGGLIDFSLVTASQRGLNVHPLVAELVRANLGSEAATYAGASVRLLERALGFASGVSTAECNARIDRLLPHVIAAADRAIACGAEPARTRSVLVLATENRTNIGQYAGARALLSRARRADPGGAALGWADLLPVTLAEARLLCESGHPSEAAPRFEEALRETAALLPADDPLLLTIRFALAESWRLSNRPDLAGPQLSALFADQSRLFGADDRRTLITRRALGFMAADDSFAHAVAAFVDLVRDEERALGPDDGETLRSRSHLAFWRFKSGEIDAAIEESAALVTDLQRVLGVEHAKTLEERTNLVNYRGRRGAYADAVRELREILAIRDRVMGPDDVDTVQGHHDLAYWLQLSGDFPAALAAQTRVVADYERVFGPTDRRTIGAQNRLADLQQKASCA
jgi:tetratricopeptide (TPR) repeat protein